MEELGGRFEGIGGNAVKRKRSHTFRRPRPESQPFSESHDFSSLSSTPPSDDTSKVSSDEGNGIDNGSSIKESDPSQSASRVPAPSGPDGEKLQKKNRKEDVSLDVLYSNSGSRDSYDQGYSGPSQKRSSEGVLAPANWRSTAQPKDGLESQSRNVVVSSSKKSSEDQCSGPTEVNVEGSGNQNKVKKVKLKVGGATRTIDANPISKSSRGLEMTAPRQKDSPDDDPSDLKSSLQGIPWKDFSRGGFPLSEGARSTAKMSGKVHSGKQGEKSDTARKSRQVPKKRVMDGAFDEEDNDEEIRYLEKLKNSKLSAGLIDEEESSRKHRRISKASGNPSEYMSGDTPPWLPKDGKKKSPFEDAEYEEDEEPVSEGDPESRKKKKQRKEPIDSLVEPKKELTFTTRQRAMQSGKDGSSSGGSVIEFPNGLPPALSRKQKEKLTEVEQQLKKAEAAQRRRMQNEKAARESEAEAIRKILGQDSNRKKREEKKKKRQEELAQEKAADALVRASSTIRWVMGRNGNAVIFPKDGLPSIFVSNPCRYPPTRENCAGPNCENKYKYRDSKTKLPLCSLQCYKAVQGTV